MCRTGRARPRHRRHTCTLRLRAQGLFIPLGRHQDPCTIQAPGRPVSSGLRREPAQCYQRVDSKDKESPLGPTNGVILGTTQKDRCGWGLRSPVILSFSSTLNEGQTKTSACLEGQRGPVLPEGHSPGWWLGRDVLRGTVSTPSWPPPSSPADLPPTGRDVGSGGGSEPLLSTSALGEG